MRAGFDRANSTTAKIAQNRLIDIFQTRNIEAAHAGLHLAQAGDKLGTFREIPSDIKHQVGFSRREADQRPAALGAAVIAEPDDGRSPEHL